MEEEEDVLHDYDACAPITTSELLPPSAIASGLRRAVAEDNIVALKHHLSNKHNVNLVDCLGSTCLHTAVMYGSLNALLFLLSLDETRINVRNHLGETPLFQALSTNAHFDIIAALVDNKCDVTTPNLMGISPLHLAVQKSNPDIAHLLIKAGADIDVKDSDGMTPLHKAVDFQNYEIICMLLYYNVSVNEESMRSLSPFDLAIMSENDQISQLLVSYVDDFSHKDSRIQSVFATALNNKMAVAVDIIENGGDVYEINFGVPLIFLRLHDEQILFRKLWAKVDIIKLFITNLEPVLLPYFLQNKYNFSDEERLSILEIVFSADDYYYNYYEPEIYQLIYELCKTPKQRLQWTYILLSHGIPIGSKEIEYLYEKYGYCPEISGIFASETYIYATGTDPFIQQLIYNQSINNRIDSGTIPSLLQFARDTCRALIYTKHQIDPNYKACNVIMRLGIPEVLKEILLLKRLI